jgi:hypothetical protein
VDSARAFQGERIRITGESYEEIQSGSLPSRFRVKSIPKTLKGGGELLA